LFVLFQSNNTYISPDWFKKWQKIGVRLAKLAFLIATALNNSIFTCLSWNNSSFQSL